MNYQEIPLRQHTLGENEWLDQQARDQHQLLPAMPSESKQERTQRVMRLAGRMSRQRKRRS